MALDPTAGAVYELEGVTFGGRREGGYMVASVSRAAASVRSQAVPAPHRHGTIPGRDYLGSSTWTFDITTDAEDNAGAYALARQLGGAWARARSLAPGELAVLRVYRAGEWFRVYGRAREFAGPEETVGTTVGTGAIVCSFEVMDPLVYGDLERSVSIGTTPSAGATGLIFPVVFDVVWDTDGVPGQRSGIVDLEGTVPAPVVVELRGPMSNPRVVHSSGWEVGVTGPLAYDEAVIFDGRTRTVRATIGGAPAPNPASRITRATRLDRLTVDPGRSEFTLFATDPTGSGQAVITWRDAHASI
jgi:hypothetical protein